jgi:hypothetical protein
LPVANASSATLIKSIFFYFYFTFCCIVPTQHNRQLSYLPVSDYAESDCKGTTFYRELSDEQRAIPHFLDYLTIYALQQTFHSQIFFVPLSHIN